jgi:hypothetical protein
LFPYLYEWQGEFIFEGLLPMTKRLGWSIKDDDIFVAPNDPTCYHYNFFENSWAKHASASDYHVLRWQWSVPMDINKSPSPFAKRAVKEEMHQVFFWIPRAEYTIMILEFHVFPFEQLSCIAYHATKAKKKKKLCLPITQASI